MSPFDPSMMVYFRKRFSEIELNRINELIAARGKAMVMEAVASLPDNDESDDPDAGSCKQISLDDLVKPADWPEDKNWEHSASMPLARQPTSPIQLI